MITYSIIQKSQLEGGLRLDAEYYQPEYLEITKSIEKVGFVLLADISNSTIIKIESGTTYNPRVETLKQIANASGVSIDGLMK